jgi:hypothetical protein
LPVSAGVFGISAGTAVIVLLSLTSRDAAPPVPDASNSSVVRL